MMETRELVVVVEPGREPRAREVFVPANQEATDALFTFAQDAVGGYIVPVSWRPGYRVYANEDGLPLELTVNRQVGLHLIVGTFVVMRLVAIEVRVGGGTDIRVYDAGLSPDEAEMVIEAFRLPPELRPN